MDSTVGSAGSRRSPLDGRSSIVDSERFSVNEIPFAAQMTVQSFGDAPAGLGIPATGEVLRTADGDVLWLGPQEWLVVRAGAEPVEVERELVAAVGDTAVVTDVSGQRTILDLSGPAARTVLAMGSSIDLHPDTFGLDRVVQTDVARINVILYRTADSAAVAADSFRLLVRSSFARYFADWLADAAVEFLRPVDAASIGDPEGVRV